MGRRVSRRVQFSMATLLLLMLLASFLLASYGGVLRERDNMQSGSYLVSLLFLLAAPLALVIVISGFRTTIAVWSRYQARKRSR